MTMEAAMALTNRLLSQAQALSAVTAYIQLRGDGRSADPALQARVERVVDLLDARESIDALSDKERAIVTAFARSYMRQAIELMEEPTRANAWTHSDPTILQAQGAASAVVARLIASIGLGAPGDRILDIGTGVGRLAIALCETFPGARVVGLDPWEPSLSLARQNVREAGLESRITLLPVPVEQLEDGEGFDLAWLPSFFIPEPVIDSAFSRVRTVLRPGGALVVGVMERPDDPLAGAVDAVATVRSGGCVLESDEAVTRLRRAGFASVNEAPRTWAAPLRLVVARPEA